MTLVSSGVIHLDIGVPTILFTATTHIPGIIGGQINANPLGNVNDIVDVQLQVKYSSGGGFVNASVISFKQSDEICWFTPIEASFGYQIILTLRTGSPSIAADLDFIMQSTSVT